MAANAAVPVSLAAEPRPTAGAEDRLTGQDSPEPEADDATERSDPGENDGDEDDGGGRLTQNPPPEPRQPSQRKRADYAAFNNWLDKNRDRITKAAPVASADPDDQSTACLFRTFEADKIIESPRDYQIELFERAKQKNIIAVLDTGEFGHPRVNSLAKIGDTGSGKTLIAAMLLRHIIAQELEDRAAGKEKRVSFFLVRISLPMTNPV